MIPRLALQQQTTPTYYSFLDALADSGFRGDIERSYASRLAVATDNSVYQCLPQAVVFPRSSQDLVVMLTLASRDAYKEIRFSPRGGGTGTNGQSLNDNIVVDLSRHMTQLVTMDAAGRRVRIQTGMVKDRLNQLVKPHNLFFSPDLSTSNRATIGGMINTDASGQGSLVYGKTSDHVLGVTAVLVDGTLIETGPVSGEALDQKLEEDSREGELYRCVYHSVTGHAGEIEQRFPKLNRFLTGYDLKHVYDKRTHTLDLTRILCGSEGSLAFITEAWLDLTPIPNCRTLVNVKYDSFESALRNAPLMVEAKALSVETVDSKVLNLAREDIVWHSVSDLIQDVPGKVMDGLNMVEYADEDETAQREKVEALCQRLDGLIERGEAGVIGYQVCDDLSSINRIYGMRKKAVGLLGNTQGRKKPVAFVEDTAVPPKHLADYIMEFRELLDNHGLQYGMFGHVDAGVLHVRPALDMTDPEQEVMLRRISDKVNALTAKYGGLMWGEHGKGFRSEYSPTFFGEVLFTELRRIKSAFDPFNRLNPGKICTPLNSLEQLVSVDATKRGYFDRQIPVHVRDGFTQAMDCNGNGLCFDFDVRSPMCPSMKLSADRRHSPKGRAGLVREWLRQLSAQGFDPMTGEAAVQSRSTSVKNMVLRIKHTLDKRRGEYDFSHEVKEAMDGCLACKACSSQCPIKVDVPTFRARFLQLYHQRYQRPPRDYLVSWVETYTPWMAKAPGLFNPIMNHKWVQSGTSSLLGMVDMPALSQPSLKKRLGNSPAAQFDLEQLQALGDEERANTLLVVQDPFTSFYDAGVVHDLVRLATALGFNPVVLPFRPNGKPAHVKGFLRRFAGMAADSAQFLNRLARLNIPMVGVDPSLVLCYRDEYAKVLGPARGDFEVLLPQEWLLGMLDRIPARESTGESWHLFAHCTEKTAKPTTHQDWSRIFAHLGATLEAVPVGCCGMAGTYGHEREHAEGSRTLFAMSWAEPLSQLPRERCLATGFSCRSQVKRIEGEGLRHPVQALLSLLA
ncbi:D-2-hydroxyglutarate dehydrogenase YdiJ [Oceanimonas smirnovii]|uniref:D-2-hydroxyglutarate dehydrogenase YdiJ n=1 Tax=Oceanimonas smirnovii TaxID=264574 RepID=UPI00036F13F2|nr:FAD-binding and (Fe-S)-binding domain-containing protein [Oceanimonas smirnovii]